MSLHGTTISMVAASMVGKGGGGGSEPDDDKDPFWKQLLIAFSPLILLCLIGWGYVIYTLVK